MDIDRLSEFKAAVLSGASAAELAAQFDVAERTVYRWKARLKETDDLPPVDTYTESETLDWDENGNYAEAYSIGPRITSVDQLLITAEVDPDEWEVIDGLAKKWEVGAKDKQGHLKWSDGKLQEGELLYNGIQVQDLWSVWARFRKRNPVALTPTVHPVSVDVVYKTGNIEAGAVLSTLAWTDPQFGYRWTGNQLDPFHDREVLDLWLQIAEWIQPARIDVLGDWFDAPGFSAFLQEPETHNTFQPAICESHWWLHQFRIACPNTEITIHPGNHDARLRKALLKHLPVAYGLRPADEMELPPSLHPARLLGLHNLDIEWVTEDYPNDESWLGNSIRLNHGIYYSSKAGATVAKAAQETDVNTVSGHNHRSEHASRTRHLRTGPETLSSYSIGCTCRIDGTVPSKHKYMDWQQSAAVIQYTDSHHNFTAIPVSNETPKKAIVNGRLFTARDRTVDLHSDLPNFNW